MLERCSTEAAGWFVIPADHNWFSNLAVAEAVADTLEAMNPQYPPSPDVLSDSLVGVYGMCVSLKTSLPCIALPTMTLGSATP